MTNPEALFPVGAIKAIHLRCPSTSGGKDWIGVVSNSPIVNGKLFVINGTTQQVVNGGGQARTVSKSATESSLQAVVAEKKAKGYKEVDVWINGRWMGQSPAPQLPVAPQQSAPPKPAPKPQVKSIPVSILTAPPVPVEEEFVWDWT